MSDNTININVDGNIDPINAKIDRIGENLKSVSEDFLSKDQFSELKGLLDKFKEVKDFGALSSGGTKAFSNFEKSAEENKQNQLEAIKKKYDSERERLDPKLQGAGRQIALADIEKREAKEESLHTTGKKEVTEVEKEWVRLLSLLKKSLDNESKDLKNKNKNNQDTVNRGTEPVNHLDDLIQATQSSGGIGNYLKNKLMNNSSRIGNAAGNAMGGGEGAMLAGAVAAGVIALGGLVIGAVLTKGYEDLRGEKKLNTVLDKNNIEAQDRYGRSLDDILNSGSDYGFKREEGRGLMSLSSKSRMTGDNASEIMYQNMRLQKALAVDGSDAGTFDKFFQSSSNKSTSADLIYQMLARNEKDGWLGMKKGDITSLSTQIKSAEQIMSYQKGKADLIDTNFAISLQQAGNTVGGAWKDDRGGSTITSLLQGISGNDNPGIKAMMMRIARQANPSGTVPELEAMIAENDPRFVKPWLNFAQEASHTGNGRTMDQFTFQALTKTTGTKSFSLMDHMGDFNKSLNTVLTQNEIDKYKNEVSDKATANTTNIDILTARISNDMTETSKNVALIAEKMLNGTNEDKAYRDDVDKIYKETGDLQKSIERAKANRSTKARDNVDNMIMTSGLSPR